MEELKKKIRQIFVFLKQCRLRDEFFEKAKNEQQKIPYPENWFEDYNLWKSGQITAEEFFERSGLKKGTFFNLCKQTKQEERHGKRSEI